MDKIYERVSQLRTQISQLKEKRASLQATIETLTAERDKYLQMLKDKGIDTANLDEVIKKYEETLSKIDTKLVKIREVIGKFLV